LKNKIILSIKLILSLSLLLLIFNSIDFTETISLLKDINLSLYFLAMLILGIQIIFANFRWQLVLKNLNFRHPFFTLLEYLWIGLFFNQALPSSIGGDAVRGYYLNKSIGSLKSATIGVLLDRMFGLIGLLILVLIVTIVFYTKLDSLTSQWLIISIVIGLFSLVGLFLSLDLAPNKYLKWKPTHIFFELASKARMLLFSKKPGLNLIFISITIHLFSILAVLILAEGLKLNVGWLGILLIVPIVILFTLIPISIAGWGVRESVMIIGLGYLNVPPEEALALSILYGVLMIMIAMPGGIIWLLSSKSFKT